MKLNLLKLQLDPVYIYFNFFCISDCSKGDYPTDSSIGARKFVLRDFVVGTSNAIFAHVTTDGTDVTVSTLIVSASLISLVVTKCMSATGWEVLDRGWVRILLGSNSVAVPVVYLTMLNDNDNDNDFI